MPIKTFFFLPLLFLSLLSNGQQFATEKVEISTASGTQTHNLLVYYPMGYDALRAYPLVVYAHGLSGAGTSTDGLFATGLPKMLRDGYRPPFDFILIVPQSPTYSPDPAWLPSLLDWSRQRWKLDTNRFYLTGVSQGGWAVLGSQLNVSPELGRRFAGLVVHSAGTQNLQQQHLRWWAESKTPLWALVGSRDPGYLLQNQSLVEALNQEAPGTALLTIRSGLAHGGWDDLYRGKVTTPNGLTIWQWMQQQTKSKESASTDNALFHTTTGTDTTLVTNKSIKVNLFRGINAYQNLEWNNWNVTASLIAQNLKYSDGTTSAVSAVLTGSNVIMDNGLTYGGGMAAAEVLRYASYSTTARTLTFTGLSSLKTYTLELYGSRNAVDVNASVYTITTQSIIVATDKNRTNKAVFYAVKPNAEGKIIINIKSATVYNCLNGFVLTENETQNLDLTGPAAIPAHQYANMNGVRILTSTDAVIGSYVSYIDADDWMDYSVQAGAAGVYTLKLKIASGLDGAQFQIKNTTGKLLATVYLPKTGGYNVWHQVSIALPLAAGAQTLRFQSTSPVRWNFNKFQIHNETTGEQATAINKISIPVSSGTLLEAENYTAMYGVSKYVTSDFAGGHQNVGAMDLNDWVNYTITTNSAGLHVVNLRVASWVSDAQFYIKDSSGKILSTVPVPNTGGWQTWRNVTAQIQLAAGTQTIVLQSAAASKWNLNYFEIAQTPANPFASYIIRPNSGSSIYHPLGLNLPHLKPGDTLNIMAGNYNVIDLGNFKGSATHPIIIKNKGGQVKCTLIRFSSTPEYFKMLGNGDPAVPYGFKIDGKSLTGSALTAYGSHFEIAYIEMMNSKSGFFIKRNPNADDPISVHPNYIMNNIRIHHNYLHHISGEGMYIGHTGADGGQDGNPLLPVRMQNVEIDNNILEEIGWDGIQLANATTGNKIHHNTITNFGTINRYAQQAGILLGGNSSGDIYDNVIKNGTGNGIQNFGFGLNKIYNNYIENVGNNGTTKGLEGVYCNDIIITSELRPKQQMQIYNNIIKYPHTWGAVRVSGYNENSLPATMQFNQVLLPNAPVDWEKKYFPTYVQNSTISNNILINE